MSKEKKIARIEKRSKESLELIKKIVEESGSETIDLVIEHELPGVTPEMIDWWWDHIDTTERYKLWHPKDHISFKWEKSPANGHVGAIHRLVETVGTPTMLRIRWEDPSSVPIKASYSHVLAGSILDSDDKPLSYFIHEYKSMQGGTRLHTTFRLPAKVPQWFIEALRKHSKEEMDQFTNFLPKLYAENK
ncbi:MAG: DAPG hydrolase family protein [Promethearchaeota archaeon]